MQALKYGSRLKAKLMDLSVQLVLAALSVVLARYIVPLPVHTSIRFQSYASLQPIKGPGAQCATYILNFYKTHPVLESFLQYLRVSYFF